MGTRSRDGRLRLDKFHSWIGDGRTHVQLIDRPGILCTTTNTSDDRKSRKRCSVSVLFRIWYRIRRRPAAGCTCNVRVWKYFSIDSGPFELLDCTRRFRHRSREEALRHFLVMMLFAALAAMVFGVVAKDTTKERWLYGLKVFAEFMVIGLVLGWLLYFIP